MVTNGSTDTDELPLAFANGNGIDSEWRRSGDRVCSKMETTEMQPIELSPDDPRVKRIARALSEGCDGRSFASNDAKWLAENYTRLRGRNPHLSFTACKLRAFSSFICKVLDTGTADYLSGCEECGGETEVVELKTGSTIYCKTCSHTKPNRM